MCASLAATKQCFALIEGACTRECVRNPQTCCEGLRRKNIARRGRSFGHWAIAGYGVDKHRRTLLNSLADTIILMPAGEPSRLIGVGDPTAFAKKIALGLDAFDYVLPIRIAQLGTALPSDERLTMRNALLAYDLAALGDERIGPVCSQHSRACIRPLVEPERDSERHTFIDSQYQLSFPCLPSFRAYVVSSGRMPLKQYVLAFVRNEEVQPFAAFAPGCTSGEGRYASLMSFPGCQRRTLIRHAYRKISSL